MSDAKTRELLPGVFLLHLPLPMKPTIVNVYLLRDGDEWALVDTGMNSGDSLAAFRAALQEVGCAPEQIRQIICTHHHPDHFGASRAHKELTGATLYLHRLEHDRAQTFARQIRSEQAAVFFRSCGIPVERFAHIPSPHEFWSSLYVTAPPDQYLEDGDVLRVGRRELHVVWTPGHSPGHCVLYLPQEKLMIVGDHLLPKITPHVGYFPGGPPDPLGDFLESQRKVQPFDVDLVLPAHGGVYGDHRRRARRIIEHHRYRMREMWDLIRTRPMSAYAIASKAFSFDIDSPLTVQFPATFETMAHLQHLIHLGQVQTAEEEGRVLYRGVAASELEAALVADD